MKKTTTATITADEIRAAIKLWLHQIKGVVELEGEISFDIVEEYDDIDWQGKWGTTPRLVGARFAIKET